MSNFDFRLAEGIASDGFAKLAELMREREQWIIRARALGATQETCEVYDKALIDYAATQPASNTQYWREGWEIAIEQLKQGNDFPKVPDGLQRIALRQFLGLQ